MMRRMSALAFIAAAGCTGLGPRSIERDRQDYGTSIGDSWKTQILHNIVKLRYMDAPVFVDVGQIVGSYSIEGTLSAGASLPRTGPNTMSFGADAKFADKPTITYMPLMGKDYVKGLLVPITPDNVFFLIEVAWPADLIFGVTVQAINGLRNRRGVGLVRTPADPGFLRVLELLRIMQDNGTLGMRVRVKEKDTATILFFRTKGVPKEQADLLTEFRILLGLKEGQDEFQLVYGSSASGDGELAVQTRSLLYMMFEMASGVEVPADHVDQKRASSSLPLDDVTLEKLGGIRLRSASSLPSNVFGSVKYRGTWFYVADDDLFSKRNLLILTMMFSMAETSQRQPLPLITISPQ